jgi:hypothetical protein
MRRYHLQKIDYRLSTIYCQRQYELVAQLIIWRLSALDWLWVSVNTHARSSCSLLRMLEMCVAWDLSPPAATGTQLVCPSPQSDCSLLQPAHVWKITLSRSRNNSCLGKNVLAFYKASLCSAVRNMLHAGRRTFPTYEGCNVVLELSLWNTTGRISLGDSETDVLKFVSSNNSTIISQRNHWRLGTR